VVSNNSAEEVATAASYNKYAFFFFPNRIALAHCNRPSGSMKALYLLKSFHHFIHAVYNYTGPTGLNNT